MWELDCEESSAPKNWCFWTVVLEETLESPLDYKEIQPVNPRGNQSEYSLEGLMVKLTLQYLGHLLQRADSLEKTWCWERLKAGGKGDTEDEMVGWLHRLYGHEFEQALGVGDGQGSLACCSPWGCKELDTTEQLNWWWLSGKESACNARDEAGGESFIAESGRSPGEGNGNCAPIFSLENPMDRGGWWATVHGGGKSVRRDSVTQQQQLKEKKTEINLRIQ